MAYLDLRCTTRDHVLEAVEKLKNNNPHANLNPDTHKEGIILPMDESPTMESAVDYSNKAEKQNEASLDCLLGNATEGRYINYLLKSTRKKYVTTDWSLNLCVYEAIVNSLYSTLVEDEFMLKKYTGVDLKNQMLIYILENYYEDQKLRDVLFSHMEETKLVGGSLCTWVEKMSRSMTWADLDLINVISHMLNLHITVLDFGGGTSNIVQWHFGQKEEADVILLYNGSTHFTGTGNF